jgi:hypothetical protein
MKTIFLKQHFCVFIFCFLTITLMSACTKCVKCTEKKGDSVVNDFPEVCGDKEMVSAYEADVQANKDPDKTMECIMR